MVSALSPALLSNLDADGTRIGVLAMRAGVTRQAAGQLLREIERCEYVERRVSPDDARATMIYFTGRKASPRHRARIVEEIEGEFAATLTRGDFERVRDGLLRIADRIDPGGRLGEGDQAALRKFKVQEEEVEVSPK